MRQHSAFAPAFLHLLRISAFPLVLKFLERCCTSGTLAPTFFPIPFPILKLCTSDIFTLPGDPVTFAWYPIKGSNSELEFNLRELLSSAIHAAGIPIVAAVFNCAGHQVRRRSSWQTILLLRSTGRMHGRVFLGLTLSVAVISMGCGGGSSIKANKTKTGTSATGTTTTGTTTTGTTTTGTTASGTTASGTTTVAAGDLEVSPTKLTFGKVTVGTWKTQIGSLTAGNSRITVTSADWSGDGFTVMGITFPVTVPAGQSVPFKVVFAPHHDGAVAGKITFQSDADNSPQVAFAGTGTETAAHSVDLAWKPPSSSVAGFNVYRGPKKSGPFSKLNGSVHPKSTFTDASVVGGSTYFYATTSVNKKGKESKFSNQVQVKIPNS